MAKRHGPTDGKRFKRPVASGNHKKKPTDLPLDQRERKVNGPVLNRTNGENLCTPEMIERLVQLIRGGNYAHVAAATCGINTRTYYDWLTKGGRGEQPYAALSQAVEKASAEAESHKVLTITKASQEHWQAAAWWLERTNAKRWGRKDALELSGDAEKPVTITVIKFGDGEIEF